MPSFKDYSATPASNNLAPPGGAPEGMAPSAVNDTMRSMMAATRTTGDATAAWVGGTSGGSANAQTLTPPITLTAYVGYQMYIFAAGFTNSGATTININGLGAKSVLKAAGTLDAGDIVAGSTAIVVLNGARSAFLLLNPQSTIPGTASARNVGTGISNLPEIVNGSGQFNASVDAAHKALDNLAGDGLKRTVWASLAFVGSTGAPFNNFNSASVTRNSVGLYTITFPNIGSNDFHVHAMMDVVSDSSGTNCNVVDGSRTTTSVQIACRKGNTSVDPFDPSRVTIVITKIG